MIKNRGIAVKLTLLILSSMTLIFALVLGYYYFFSKEIVVKNIRNNALNLTLATVNRIDKVLLSVEKVPQNVAYSMENFQYDRRQIIDLVRTVVRNNTDIYGATIAFAPYAYAEAVKGFAPYCYKKSVQEIAFTEIPYDYFYWDWFQIPKELNRPAWSEPYYDKGAGNTMMATYSVPFYRNVTGGRKFLGVVTADISLDWLRKIVESIRIEETGYGFLISKDGTFVTHPRSQLIMNETIFSLSEDLNKPELRELGRKMIRGESGYAPYKSLVTGKMCWLAYEPLPSNGWSLGILFPQDELMRDITRLNQKVIYISLMGFVFIFLVIVWIAGTITRPLRALSRSAAHIGVGNLDVGLPDVASQDEVGRLAGALDSMRISLKQYIEDLKETTAAKERIESELKIAHDIQMGILHKIFPPFPDRKEFDIYATIEPAKEVGGDFYDFFFLDDDHLCFAVGDVSGKGVPAALFMAVTKTLVMTKATKGSTSETILSRVNKDLSLDNPSMMFVTLFLGILNIHTGELDYCNGGHNPPYILRRNGVIESLEMTGGMALGIMEDFSFQSKKAHMQEGDTIFLYTDGVTEATNRAEELFSGGRLEKDLATLYERPLTALVGGVMERIKVFSEGMPQSDDITMLVLRYFGVKGTKKGCAAENTRRKGPGAVGLSNGRRLFPSAS